jgi:ABC-type amino acid transport substrate-binding protein
MIKKAFAKLILLFCILTSCTSMKKDNILRVGISPDYPPFAFKINEQFSGSDVEMIQKIAHKLGKKIEFKEMDFGTLIPALLANKIDLAISGVSPTPERAKKVLFTYPYHVEKNCFLFNNNFHNFTQITDIQNKKVAAALGTVQQQIVEKYFPNCKFYNNNFQIVEELKLGRVDGWIIGEIQCEEFIQKYPEFKYFKLPDAYNVDYSLAIALRFSDKELADKINKIIEQGV